MFGRIKALLNLIGNLDCLVKMGVLMFFYTTTVQATRLPTTSNSLLRYNLS